MCTLLVQKGRGGLPSREEQGARSRGWDDLRRVAGYLHLAVGSCTRAGVLTVDAPFRSMLMDELLHVLSVRSGSSGVRSVRYGAARSAHGTL